jgi:hypothetical protein
MEAGVPRLIIEGLSLSREILKDRAGSEIIVQR